MNYYKTLVNGRSFHGGEFEYSLPKNGKSGKWHKITDPLQMCAVGFHITSEPAKWWRKDAQCYLAEYRGEVLTEAGSDKICVAEVRLVREVDPAEVQIFYEGEHEVTNGLCLASGSATVWAYGFATVWASGSATVWAYGSATVRAYDSATVRAYDSATVRAYDSATVRAYDSATVNKRSSHSTVNLKDNAIEIDRTTKPPTIRGNYQEAE